MFSYDNVMNLWGCPALLAQIIGGFSGIGLAFAGFYFWLWIKGQL